MNKYQKSTLKMYDAVDSQLASKEALIATKPALQRSVGNFRLRLVNFHANESKNKRVLTGMTTDKQELKTLLADRFSENGAQVAAYAFDTGNNTLRENMDFSLNQLSRQPEDDLHAICTHMLTEMNPYKGQLDEYGIDDATFTELGQLLDDYKTEKPLHSNALADRSAWVNRRNDELKAIGRVLRFSIDKLMRPFKKTHAEFYAAYRLNRAARKPATRQTKLTGLLTEAVSSAPVNKGLVVAVDLTTGQRYEAYTNVKGYFTLLLPVAGTYTISFSHPVYGIALEQTIEISPGEIKKTNAALRVFG